MASPPTYPRRSHRNVRVNRHGSISIGGRKKPPRSLASTLHNRRRVKRQAPPALSEQPTELDRTLRNGFDDNAEDRNGNDGNVSADCAAPSASSPEYAAAIAALVGETVAAPPLTASDFGSDGASAAAQSLGALIAKTTVDLVEHIPGGAKWWGMRGVAGQGETNGADAGNAAAAAAAALVHPPPTAAEVAAALELRTALVRHEYAKDLAVIVAKSEAWQARHDEALSAAHADAEAARIARVRGIALRLAHRGLFASFNGWVNTAERRARLRRILQTFSAGSVTRSQRTVLVAWRAALAHSKRRNAVEQIASKRHTRKRLRSTVQRWEKHVVRKKEMMRVARSITLHMGGRSKHNSFARWRTALATGKAERAVMRRVLSLLSVNGMKLLRSALATWRSHTYGAAQHHLSSELSALKTALTEAEHSATERQLDVARMIPTPVSSRADAKTQLAARVQQATEAGAAELAKHIRAHKEKLEAQSAMHKTYSAEMIQAHAKLVAELRGSIDAERRSAAETRASHAAELLQHAGAHAQALLQSAAAAEQAVQRRTSDLDAAHAAAVHSLSGDPQRIAARMLQQGAGAPGSIGSASSRLAMPFALNIVGAVAAAEAGAMGSAPWQDALVEAIAAALDLTTSDRLFLSDVEVGPRRQADCRGILGPVVTLTLWIQPPLLDAWAGAVDSEEVQQRLISRSRDGARNALATKCGFSKPVLRADLRKSLDAGAQYRCAVAREVQLARRSAAAREALAAEAAQQKQNAYMWWQRAQLKPAVPPNEEEEEEEEEEEVTLSGGKEEEEDENTYAVAEERDDRPGVQEASPKRRPPHRTAPRRPGTVRVNRHGSISITRRALVALAPRSTRQRRDVV